MTNKDRKDWIMLALGAVILIAYAIWAPALARWFVANDVDVVIGVLALFIPFGIIFWICVRYGK